MSRKNISQKDKKKQANIDRLISKKHNQKMQNLAAKPAAPQKKTDDSDESDEYYDSSDEEYHTDHSAYVSRKWSESGIAPSFGQCHNEYGILDYELWEKAYTEANDNYRNGYF